MYAAPPVIETEVFASIPDEMRVKENPRPQSGVPGHCLLEGGPSTKLMYSHLD